MRALSQSGNEFVEYDHDNDGGIAMLYPRTVSRLCTCALLALTALVTPAADYTNRTYQEIEVDQPTYLARKNKAWEAQSRVVGVLRKPPAEFTITFINPLTLQEFRKEVHSGTISVYESGWLPMGQYDVLIQAEGFLDQRIPGVKLKAKSDCVINLFFNPKLYRR
jgi:hypothetical protein